ncbi:MAG: hypothetical protein RL308_254 [Bacteroidota bacterium]|jgi:hypothetical protein
MLLSEDDVRTKVVYEWLKDCSIEPNEISIEFTIKLKLGHGVRTIYSRSDILVRNSKGDNLLIIEVKKPNHQLHQDDKSQAISYARALAEGGIAPFTVLTNGTDTLIFDSVSGEELSGNSVQASHKYVKNQFKVTGDALSAYSEALNYLVSVSDDNLLEFCKGQTQYRMSLLKSDDLFSGKKYIPQTYVDRIGPKKELDDKLFLNESTWDVLLVTGPPQHGKTSFVCNVIDTYQSRNIPCLFYPAISLKEGLLNALIDDFQWAFNSNFSIVQMAQRLNSILERSNLHLVIVIDGWNEMFDTPLRLNEECRRLNSGRIKVVISSTSASLERMLYDGAGNFEFIGSAVKLKREQIRKLCSEPLQNTKDLGVLQIGKFNSEELAEAKLKYEKAFHVQFEEGGNLPNEPYYLRLASEQYANCTIPAFANRSSLIHNSLIAKGRRSNIVELELLRGLIALSEVLFSRDTPIELVSMPVMFNSTSLTFWCESAILQELKNDISTKIDFYYSHDRDYSVAILYRKWHELFQNSTPIKEITNELLQTTSTEVGRSALQWFLSCPDYIDHLRIVFSALSKVSNENLLKIVIQSILSQVKLNNKIEFVWLEKYLSELISIEKNQGIEESKVVQLIYAYIISIDRVKDKTHFEFWISILLKYDNSIDDLGIDDSFMSQIYGEIEGFDGYLSSALDIDLFEMLLLHHDEEVATKAALYLAYASPKEFLESYANYSEKIFDVRGDGKIILKLACDKVANYLGDIYYGYMCPGVLDGAEEGDDYLREDYYRLKPLLVPIIGTYSFTSIGEYLMNLLNNLRIKASINEEIDEETHFDDPDQLKFDL